jgi:hypothetical protein
MKKCSLYNETIGFVGTYAVAPFLVVVRNAGCTNNDCYQNLSTVHPNRERIHGCRLVGLDHAWRQGLLNFAL